MGSGYLSLKHKKMISNRPEHVKLTFDNIEKMHFTDLQGNGEDDFKPSDILDDEDDFQDAEVAKRIQNSKEAYFSVNNPTSGGPPKEQVLYMAGQETLNNKKHQKQQKTFDQQPLSHNVSRSQIGEKQSLSQSKRRGLAVNQSGIYSQQRNPYQNQVNMSQNDLQNSKLFKEPPVNHLGQLSPISQRTKPSNASSTNRVNRLKNL